MPGDRRGIILMSALRCLCRYRHKERTREAFEKLRVVADSWPKAWLVPYNLACYCAQLGRLEECATWFQRAMMADENKSKLAAIDDPDLKPLWDSMSGTFWKRTD